MINDGGPAFPATPFIGPSGDVSWPIGGMTMRDYFAAAALTGLCDHYGATKDAGMLSEWAIGVADAMIEQRNKETV